MDSIDYADQAWMPSRDCWQRVAQEELRWMDAEITIAEQAETIERFREHRLASIAYDNRDVSCSADEHRALLARWSSAEAAITAADMGE